MRPQEYYESPFNNIRGKYFSVEEYMDTYAKENGSFTYLTDWCGFNIPSDSFKNFFETFSYDLTRKERILFQMVNGMRPNLKDEFYIIGACKQKKNKITIAHEIAHANWFLYPEYKEKMIELTKEIPTYLYEDAYYSLKNFGYFDSMIDDEIQAYMATAPRKDLLGHFGWSKHPNLRIPLAIKKYYEEFNLKNTPVTLRTKLLDKKAEK